MSVDWAIPRRERVVREIKVCARAGCGREFARRGDEPRAEWERHAHCSNRCGALVQHARAALLRDEAGREVAASLRPSERVQGIMERHGLGRAADAPEWPACGRL